MEGSISESIPNILMSGPSITQHNPAFSFCLFSQTYVNCNPRSPWRHHAEARLPPSAARKLAGRPTLRMTPACGQKELLELLKRLICFWRLDLDKICLADNE